MATELLSLSPSSRSTASPYNTAPSSPKLLAGDPSESECRLRQPACSFVPFIWEEKPGKPKSFPGDDDDDHYGDVGFEFCVDRLDSFSLPAEELFDGGKIKPLKPPPRLQIGASDLADSPAVSGGRRSLSQSSRRMVPAWSSRRSYDFSDPFEAAIESARKGDGLCEESGKTVSFRLSSRLRTLLPFRRFSTERSREILKASAGFGSTGSSGSGLGSSSGSSSLSGSAHEPDSGFEVTKRRSMLHKHLMGCLSKRVPESNIRNLA